MSFKEMELYGNWGSKGFLYVDGELFESLEFGGIPTNSRNPDSEYRLNEIQLNKLVSIVELIVTDITKDSEIFIDDILILGE